MNPDDTVEQLEPAFELDCHWQNQDLMTEAVQAVLRFFIRETGLNRCTTTTRGGSASGRVMEKCGMRYEGTMR